MNLPLSTVVAPADPNVEGANSGMNAGSCFCGIGIATGEFGYKEDDFGEVAITPVQSQAIGGALTNLLAVEYGDADFNDTVGLVVTTGETVADAQIGVTGYFNKTGETVPTATWLWGVAPVA